MGLGFPLRGSSPSEFLEHQFVGFQGGPAPLIAIGEGWLGHAPSHVHVPCSARQWVGRVRTTRQLH